MSLQISEITKSEIPEVVALWQKCELTRPWNDPGRDIDFAMSSDNATILVGKIENEIVAGVMTGHDGHRGAIYYLAVDPAHQSKGLGREIHNAAVAWLKSIGVWKINLLVRNQNEKVHGFYQKLGYSTNEVLSFGKMLD